MVKIAIIEESIYPCLDDILTKYEFSTFFLIKPGNYTITKNFVIDRDNINIFGETSDPGDVLIQQITPGMDGIVINADHITLKNVSVKVDNGENVCLSHYDSNYSNIQNCHFYGSDTHFTIFFAGPSDLEMGESTVNGYFNDNLDMYNIFDNNIIFTRWNGDAISISLQKYCSFRGNIVRGGKVAVYMCKNTLVTLNQIYDSTSEGIFVSLPSHDLTISHNKIRKCENAGISMRPQVEHGPTLMEDYRIDIRDNIIINSGFIGIELNSVQLCTIKNNYVNKTKLSGIYLLNNDNCTIDDNELFEPNRGIFVDSSDFVTITNNEIISTNKYLTDHGIYLQNIPDTLNIIVAGNMIIGEYVSVPIFPSENIFDVSNTNTEKIQRQGYKLNLLDQ